MSNDYTVYWVFGASSVGKKAYIKHCVSSYLSSRASHIDDGPIDREEIVCASSKSNLFVRWQWGREHDLAYLLKNETSVYQKIILVEAVIKTHYMRALGRGEEWTKQTLVREAMGIYWMCLGLTQDLSIPLTRVDITSDDKDTWVVPKPFSTTGK